MLLGAQVNSAPYPYGQRGVGPLWLIWAVVCLLAAVQVQMFSLLWTFPSAGVTGMPILRLKGQRSGDGHIICRHWTDLCFKLLNDHCLRCWCVARCSSTAEIMCLPVLIAHSWRCADVLEVNSVAVDWISDHIYWTDGRKRSVEVAEFDGSNRRILITEQLSQPRAVYADPINGCVAFTNLAWWRNGRASDLRLRGRGFDSRSGRCRAVSTGMGDCPRTGKPFWYITTHQGQLSLPCLRVW